MSSNSSGNVGLWNIKSFRLYMALLFGFAVFANALIRNTLSMGIVCMVNTTAVRQLNELYGLNQSIKIIAPIVDNSSCQPVDYVKTEYEGPFVWTSAEQGFLFSALFIGGLISILPSGLLSDRYNPKAMVTVGLLCSAIGCNMVPVTAYHGGYIALFALRFIMGFFGQAIMITGISSISARWIPPAERSTVLALYTAGNQMANIVGMPINALLCRSKHFLGGWPAIFYVNGTFGFVACFFWVIFVSNVPETNRFVSEKEKMYIAKSLANQNLGKRKDLHMRSIPWKSMLLSPVMITCFLCNLTCGFLVTILMTYLPTYFKEALLLDLKSNGLFSALPYISQWVSKVFFAVIADLMKKKTSISHTMISKCFNSFAMFGTSIFLIACAYMDCTNAMWAVIFLTLANTMFSGIVPGWATCLLSIAPAYTGIVGAMSRFAGQLGAVLAPYVVSVITVEGTVYEWRTVFLVIASVVTFSGILFNIFGSADLQEWAKQPVVDINKNGSEAAHLTEAQVPPLLTHQLSDDLSAKSIIL